MPYDAPAANVTSNSAIVIRLLLGFFDAVGRQTESDERGGRDRVEQCICGVYGKYECL